MVLQYILQQFCITYQEFTYVNIENLTCMFSNTIRDSLMPFDPGLTSFPPELASLVMVTRYITVATLAVGVLHTNRFC